MKLEFEYGQGLMAAELPDENTDVFIPGVTIPDPECLPQDWDSLYNATLESHPSSHRHARRCANWPRPGKHGRLRHPRHRQGRLPAHQRIASVAIRACLDELYAGGRGEEGYSCFCSPTGFIPARRSPRCRPDPGRGAVQRILLHQPDHQPRLRGLRSTWSTSGCTGRGDPVLMNKYVYECDMPDSHRPHPGQPLRRLLGRL